MSVIDQAPETIFESRFLRLVKRGRWEYAERTGTRTAAMIVAVTDQGNLLLVEQPRPAMGGPVIELPAGLVGDEAWLSGENAADCARRELIEETGYEASVIEPLMAGASSPGMANEVVAFFRARGLRKVSDLLGVGDEEITLHEIPLNGIEDWLRMRIAGGATVDVKILTGVFLARSDASWPPFPQGMALAGTRDRA